jgi:hypothetical protein
MPCHEGLARQVAGGEDGPQILTAKTMKKQPSKKGLPALQFNFKPIKPKRNARTNISRDILRAVTRGI